MNWQQQQKDEHESIFNNGGDFWLPTKVQESQLNLIFQRKAFQKQVKSRKWEIVHLELYVDKLVKIVNNQAEYCNINACYLKKIKYLNPQFNLISMGLDQIMANIEPNSLQKVKIIMKNGNLF
ncbi:unnamed protein product [Paramecium octaurelia]|uniref:Uncharacterized protein n=1 Tax=Paramecium octaurelia TaxID=43137 RepID=A0A8S1X7M6_PAROT|nr:unnamed protein product [Paramecium octaurelia]